MKPAPALMLIMSLAMPLAMRAAETAADPAPNSVAAGFKHISMIDLIDQVARRTGTQFAVDPRVRAEVPLAGMDPRQVDLERLRAILRVHQFVAVQEDGFISVLPDATARQLPTRTFYDLKFTAANDELVTLVLTAKSACSAHAVPVLRPLMPQAAHLAAFPPNVLIINDRAANARRIAEIFLQLDKVGDGSGCRFGEAK